MKKTFGIFAHVDAGKTTLSERILFETGVTKSFLRTDKGESLLDGDDLERKRGITVFSDCAVFSFEDSTFQLVDTPGHEDFSGETLRVLDALDFAVIVVDGGDSVRPRTRFLYKTITEKGLPCIIFVNKIDLESFSKEKLINDIVSFLTPSAIELDDCTETNTELCEFLGDRDDEFAEKYLDGDLNEDYISLTVRNQFYSGSLVPLIFGSALEGKNTDELLKMFNTMVKNDYHAEDGPSFNVFRKRRMGQKNYTFVKMNAGRIKPRDILEVNGETVKINEIYSYKGTELIPVAYADAGDIAAFTGTEALTIGMFFKDGKLISEKVLELPIMTSKVEAEQIDKHHLYQSLCELAVEEPMIAPVFNTENGEILIHVSGPIQLEILTELLRRRFDIIPKFSNPSVNFKETIREPVIGFGHYEPLRHYAEVQLAIIPRERGTGTTFRSLCHVDVLPIQYQRAIEEYCFDRPLAGVLTCSPVTDVEFCLLSGRAHDKHTEGGDFREATHRAMRQALEKRECVLLEPYSKAEIEIPSELAGKTISSINAMHGSQFEFETVGEKTIIKVEAPSRLLIPFCAGIPSDTHGEGDSVVENTQYKESPDSSELILEAGYDRTQDRINTSNSIFCTHGAGYTVNWMEADELAHTRNKRTDNEILREYKLV